MAGELDPVVLTRQALLILEQRMVDHPGDLPSGALLRLAETLAKLEMARLAALPPAPTEDHELSVADILSQTGLPPERRLELLHAEAARLGGEHQKVLAAINELNAPAAA